MCRIYKKAGRSYVRLCYRFGARRGEKVYFEGPSPLANSRHYRASKAKQSRAGRCHLLTFSITLFTNQHVVDDMARYADAKATWDKEGGTVALFSKKGWRNHDMIVSRASTFGWRRT